MSVKQHGNVLLNMTRHCQNSSERGEIGERGFQILNVNYKSCWTQLKAPVPGATNHAETLQHLIKYISTYTLLLYI